MSWSVAPEAPARQYGPAWSTDPAPPPAVSRGGWFALVNYLIPFGGEGGLAASVVPHGAGVGELRGSGRLSATVSPRYALTAVFTGLGQALVQPTPAKAFAAQLGAEGALSAIINDGLTASVAPSFTIAAAFSGGGDLVNASGDMDGLTAIVVIGSTGGSALVDAMFDAAGNLTAQAFQADGLHASIRPGTGGAPPPGPSDGFIRADSTTSAGPDWTNRNGVVGVSGNNAYGVTPGSWNIASHNTAMGSDDMEASITLGASTTLGGWDYVLVMVGCDTSGRGVFAFINASAGELVVCDNTDWSVGSYTVVGTGSGLSWTTGTVIKLGRVGNMYTGYMDGVPVVSWPDSSNSVPRDSSHRLVAFGTYNDTNGSRFIDSFEAL